MPKLEKDEILFLNNITFNILPKKYIDPIRASATPTISNIEIYTSPSTPVTVTNFLGGADGQDLYILGNGNLTISNNSDIKTSTGANKILAANKIYHFKLINDVWYEVTS